MNQEITLNLDEYIIERFRTNATGAQDCQERINQALPDHIRLHASLPRPKPRKSQHRTGSPTTLK